MLRRQARGSQARIRLSPSVARRLLGLLAAPLPVVVVLLFTTAAQNAGETPLVDAVVSVAPVLVPALYVGTLLIAALVAAPAICFVSTSRGHRLVDYLVVGAGTGLLTMLGYHTALTGLSLDINSGELLRLLVIGASLGTVSGGVAFWAAMSGQRGRGRGDQANRI
jgi:hypothetical protein